MIEAREVQSVSEFLDVVQEDFGEWKTDQRPWFRGEPSGIVEGEEIIPLVPKVYRARRDGSRHDENALLQFFRMKAPTLGLPIVPDRDEIDKWLFVAQHVGLPTRLLDWTEVSMIALHFSLRERNPVVWMLNPLALNRHAVQQFGVDPNLVRPNEPTITWVRDTMKDGKTIWNIYAVYIVDAWELGRIAGALQGETPRLPVAIHPTNIHPRMHAQKSCFTVHPPPPDARIGPSSLVGPECLRRYDIRMTEKQKEAAVEHLRRFGITHSALFPEPEGLAKELEQFF